MNVAKVIKDLGGEEKIIADLKEAGITDIKSTKTIQKWRERKIIPMKRWVQLCDMHKKLTGKTLTLAKYTKACK